MNRPDQDSSASDYEYSVRAGDVPILLSPEEAAAAIDFVRIRLDVQGLSDDVRNSLNGQLQFLEAKASEAAAFDRFMKDGETLAQDRFMSAVREIRR